MGKTNIRKKMLQKRMLLSFKEMHEMEMSILSAFQERSSVFSKKTVALYADFKNEVPTLSLFTYLTSIDCPVVYPKNYFMPSKSGKYDARASARGIRFYGVDKLSALEKGPCGILEPKYDAPEVRFSDIDVFIVPAIVFDKRGFRIGYGAGCYDKVFSKLKDLSSDRQKFLMGLAYDFQIVDYFEEEKHDIPVSSILTEKRWLECQEGSLWN